MKNSIVKFNFCHSDQVTNRTSKLWWQPKMTQLGEQAIAIRLTDSNDDAFYFLSHYLIDANLSISSKDSPVN